MRLRRSVLDRVSPHRELISVILVRVENFPSFSIFLTTLYSAGTPFFLPGPQSPITGYPEGYNSTISGTSGNITVNGTLTYKQSTPSLLKTIKGLARREMLKRSAGSGTSINYVGQSQLDVQDITFPP